MSATATEVQAPAQTAPDAAESEAPAQQSSGRESPEKKDKAGKDKGKSKGKKSKDAKSAPDSIDSSAPSVAAHPRAARSVARAKSWGALAGFFIAGYLSLPTGTLAEAGLRALVAGSVCYLVVWAGAVFVWRRLVIIEIKGREQQLMSDAQPALPQSELSAVPAERSSARIAS